MNEITINVDGIDRLEQCMSAILDKLQQIEDLCLKQSEKTDDQMLTIKEAAVYANYAESTMRGIVAKGAIPYSQPNGGRRFFKKSDIDKWKENHRHASNSEISQKATTKQVLANCHF